MPGLLRAELSWLIWGLLMAIIAGLVVGQVLLLALVFCFGYSVWLLLRMSSITQWLESGATASKAPETTGFMDKVVGLIHREKSYSRKQKNRYRSALARFNSLAAHLPDATIVLDELRQIQWCNAAAKPLLNVHPERDIGQRIDNLVRDPEFHQFLAHANNAAKADSEETEMNMAFNPSVTLSLIMVRAGKGMTVLIARDISQRVKVREMRKAFVADVSHELRTPLTVIRGYLETLVEEKDLPAHVHNNLLQVNEHSERMQHIVDHLLQLSKLEGNPLRDKEGEAVLMGPLIQGIVTQLREASNTSHPIDTRIDDSVVILGSENELYSACNNLVANAVNYTKAGTPITVSWRINAGGNPEFEVRDRGAGIEAHHLPRLSERFYRVDKARSRESGGTGLGLAIAKHAAHRHGANLHIDSVPGEGSTFRIEFPANRLCVGATVVNL